MASSTDGGVTALVDEEISSILAKFSGERRVPAAGSMMVESVRIARIIDPIPPSWAYSVSLNHNYDEVAIINLRDKAGRARRHYFLLGSQATSAAVRGGEVMC